MIAVRVFKRSGRKFYQAEWTDPVTGKLRSKSTKQSTKRDAERFAAKLEEELLRGDDTNSRYLTWKSFRQRYEEEVLTGQSPRTATTVATGQSASNLVASSPKVVDAVKNAPLQSREGPHEGPYDVTETVDERIHDGPLDFDFTPH